MNHLELKKEVLRDFQKLRDTTEDRLATAYDKERRKFKIEKTRNYPKVYPVKTATKNNWLIFVKKAPAEEIYKGFDTMNVCYVVYFYGSAGLSVINIGPAHLELYYGHFFKRYNERMKLGLDNTLDAVKKFFANGGFGIYSIIKKDGKDYSIGVSGEGILLGEVKHNRQWVINKTFISRDIMRSDQDATEKELINTLNNDIIKALINRQDDAYKKSSNIVAALTSFRGNIS
jgi:hypothetical protein